MQKIPTELVNFFSNIHFQHYPKIAIPQSFQDGRGSILNIADGNLGDVAIVSSVSGATRANHVHETDWHLSYCVTGALEYSYIGELGRLSNVNIRMGELFFTPAGTPHRMRFFEETVLVVVSRNSRKRDKYEEDTRQYILGLTIE